MKASDFHFHVGEFDKDARPVPKDYSLPLVKAKGSRPVDVEFRSQYGVQVSLVTLDGEVVFLEEGQIVRVKDRLEGFAAIQVRCAGDWCYSGYVDRAWLERIDKTPAQVYVQQPVDAARQAVRDELQRILGEKRARSLTSAVELRELIDDFFNGDVDFDEDEDEFGKGYTEVEVDDDDPSEAAEPPPNGPKGQKDPSPPKPAGDAPKPVGAVSDGPPAPEPPKP